MDEGWSSGLASARLLAQRVSTVWSAGQVEHRPDGAAVWQAGLALADGDRERGIQRGGEGGETRPEVVWAAGAGQWTVAAVGSRPGNEVAQAQLAGDGGEQAQTLAVARHQAEDRLHGRCPAKPRA